MKRRGKKSAAVFRSMPKKKKNAALKTKRRVLVVRLGKKTGRGSRRLRKKMPSAIRKSAKRRLSGISKNKKIKKVFRRKVAKRAKARMEARRKDVLPLFSAESLFKAKIKVIGIGGGGSSIVSEIGRSINKANFLVADTDSRSFRKKEGVKRFLFGQKFTRGLGTGANPDLAKKAALEVREKIDQLFDGQDIVILVASLGGGVGSGATQVFAEASRNFGGISFGIFTLPFKFEGQNKHRIAAKSIKELRDTLNVSLTIPNERIFKIIKDDTPITQAFSMVNKNLIESLESLIDLIYTPGIINIDFADVKTILRGKGNLAFLNTVESHGKNKAEKIIQKVLNNPLYQHHNFKIDRILFNISGGNNLSMVEVQKISDYVRSLNPAAKIIFGISKNLKFSDKIKTTILATGSQTIPANPVIKRKTAKTVREKEKTVVLKKKKLPASSKKPAEKREKVSFEILPPVFSGASLEAENVAKISVGEMPDKGKKPLRRTALEIREAQAMQEHKKTEQEKEWEIPAFLRFKK